MDQQDQINSVIVKITMDGTENEPRFVVEEVTAQPGSCFEGVESLHRARFECLCCKTGYVLLPLIMQTAPIRTEMEVSIAENDSTPIEEIVEQDSEEETASTLNEAVDSGKEQKHDDEFDDVKMEAELLLPEDSFEMAPLDNQVRVGQMTDLEEGDFDLNTSERSLDEVVYSDEGDGNVDLEMEGDQTLKLQGLRSKVVARLDRVDEKAQEEDTFVAPVEPQEPNVEKLFYQCGICKAALKYRRSLNTHMKIHLGIRYSCSECPKSFSLKSHLNAHKKDFHQSKIRICEVCRWSNTCTKAEYYSHLRRRHPDFRIKKRQSKLQNFNGVDFPCVYCEPKLTFESFEELKDHLSLAHDRNFACTRCPKAWIQKVHLKSHIETVHEKKKFKCPKCDKLFVWKGSLNRHLRSHK